MADMSITNNEYLLMRDVTPGSGGVSWNGADNLSTEQQRQIEQGNYGKVTDVKILDSGQITITTDLGVLTISDGPMLEEARAALEDAGMVETKLSAQADQIDRMYAMMKMIMGILSKMSKMSMDGANAAAFSAYDQKQKQADDMVNAAICSFVFSMASAGTSVLGGFCGGGAALSKGANAGAFSQSVQMGFGGVDKGFGAFGQLLSGIFQSEATRHESEAQKQEAFVQTLNQMNQNIKSCMDKLLQTCSSFTQAQTQANSRILG